MPASTRMEVAFAKFCSQKLRLGLLSLGADCSNCTNTGHPWVNNKHTTRQYLVLNKKVYLAHRHQTKSLASAYQQLHSIDQVEDMRIFRTYNRRRNLLLPTQARYHHNTQNTHFSPTSSCFFLQFRSYISKRKLSAEWLTGPLSYPCLCSWRTTTYR
jgi:hypothetical protein